MKKKKVFYISIEGGDGSGKTTLVKNLVSFFNKIKKNILLTKEFGSEHNKFCSELRKIALSSEYDIDETAGQILFAAIVKQHMEKVIKPNLNNPNIEIILSDRGIDSNFAYGPSHGISNKIIKQIFTPAYEKAKKPDLTFYLDIDPNLAARRRAERTPEAFKNNGIDRVESKGISLQKKVRKNFLSIAKAEPKRVKIIKIDEKKSPEAVLNEVIAILKKNKII